MSNMLFGAQEAFRLQLQKFVASFLFPSNGKDWFVEKGYGKGKNGKKVSDPFQNFVDTQKNDPKAHYYKEFQGLALERDSVKSRLVSGEQCKLEIMRTTPQGHALMAGSGKHIVYFPGANTYYQACFRDIAAAAKETGATVHAFNFPGTGASTGRVREANDVINAGIAVVNDLIRQGVHPDDIVLQGDCYGAAIALEVQEQFKRQSDINMRLVCNNAFKSFEGAIVDMITASPYIPRFLKSIVRKLLQFTGWDIRPGDKFIASTPYRCYLQHSDDSTLMTCKLSGQIQEHREQIRAGEIEDPCPEDYRKTRDRIDRESLVQVKLSQKNRLKKFGTDKFGRENAHFADVCELETPAGESVYSTVINDYIESSTQHLLKHPGQNVDLTKLPCLLRPATSIEITLQERDHMEELANQLVTVGKEFIQARQNGLNSSGEIPHASPSNSTETSLHDSSESALENSDRPQSPASPDVTLRPRFFSREFEKELANTAVMARPTVKVTG